MNRQSAIEAADILRKATDGARIDNLPPELIPGSIEAAYEIQDAVVDGQEIGGWKVAPPSPGQAPRCSVIAASRIVPNGSSLPPESRAPEVEVEIAFKLGRDLPGIDRSYDRQEIIEAIESTHVAFEILDSRFTDRKKVSVLTALADAQSNCLVIVGEGVDGYPATTSMRPVLTMRGMTFDVEKALPENDTLLETVAWLATHAALRGRPLTAGQIIITGSRVGPIPVAPSTLMEAEVVGIGRVRSQLYSTEIA